MQKGRERFLVCGVRGREHLTRWIDVIRSPQPPLVLVHCNSPLYTENPRTSTYTCNMHGFTIHTRQSHQLQYWAAAPTYYYCCPLKKKKGTHTQKKNYRYNSSMVFERCTLLLFEPFSMSLSSGRPAQIVLGPVRHSGPSLIECIMGMSLMWRYQVTGSPFISHLFLTGCAKSTHSKREREQEKGLTSSS